MVRIVWNPMGFHMLEALPKGRTFGAEYYRDNIPTALVSLRRERREKTYYPCRQGKGL
jgi:hypothetical protein